jgi:hypothetical protein
MASCVFGWPEFSQASVSYTPVYSGGSYAATLPLTNVFDRRLSKVARTSDATVGSCTFDVDLGVARPVGLLAVLIPNLTKSATPTIRWTGGTTVGASDVYDSGTVQAWPSSYTAEDANGLNVWKPTIPASAQTARYWRFLCTDTANVDGHLDFARVLIAGAYTPTYNLSVGGKSQLESETVRTITDGGSAVYQPKPRRRSDTFAVRNLSTTETYQTVRKMQRQLGTSGQLFWVYDSADTAILMAERAYLCVMKELGALDAPSSTFNDANFSLVEEL